MSRLLAIALGFALVINVGFATQQPGKPSSTPKSGPVSTSKSVAGTWALISADGDVQRHIRFVLNPSGTFKFVGAGFRSEGVFSVANETLTLTYLKSDGIALKQPGKQTLNFVDDGRAFVINRFKYAKR